MSGQVQRGRRARLVGLLDQLPHERLGDLPEVQRRQVAEPQREHPRGQRERAAVRPHEAQVLEGEQDPPRGGAGETGQAGDVAQAQPRVLPGEDLQDGEATLQRLQGVGAGRFVGHGRTLTPVRSLSEHSSGRQGASRGRRPVSSAIMVR